MGRNRDLPTNPKLDAILEAYFDPIGPSIKSVLDLTSSPGTDPTIVTREDARAAVYEWLKTLTQDELAALGGYYRTRVQADHQSKVAARTRQEVRNLQRSRRFKTAISEVERRYKEKPR